MISTKRKLVAAVLLAVGLLGTGTSVLVQQDRAAGQTPAVAAANDKAPGQPGGEVKNADVFSDMLPEGALARMGTLRWRHSAPVPFLGFVDEGKNLLTASQDGFFRVWDVKNGKQVRRFGKGGGAVKDPNTGMWMQAGGAVTAMPANITLGEALSPDGKTLAVSGQDGIVRLWSVINGKEERSIGSAQVRVFGNGGMAFSPDSKTIALNCHDQSIRLFEVETAKEIRQLSKPPAGRRILFHGGVNSMAFAPDGKSIASVMEQENNQRRPVGLLQFFEVETGKALRTINSQGSNFGIAGVAFAPDGKSLAWSSSTTIRVYEAETGKELRTSQHGISYTMLVYSPNGKMLATRSTRSPAIQLWDVDNGKVLRTLSDALATGPGNGNAFIRVGIDDNAQTVAFSPDGKIVAEATIGNSISTIGRSIRLWDVAQGKEIPPPPSTGHQGGISSMAVTPDGKTLITCGQDNSIRRWEIATGREVGEFKLPAGALNPTLSRDGQLVAFGSQNSTVAIWDAAQGKELRSVSVPVSQNGKVVRGQGGIAFSPDRKTLAVRGFDPAIYLFETTTGRQLHSLSEQPMNPADPNRAVIFTGSGFQPGRAQGLVFSPDGQSLAAIGAGEPVGGVVVGNVVRQPAVNFAVRLWNVSAGKPMARLDCQQRAVTAMAYLPDNTAVVTAHTDNSITVWEVLTGKEYFTIKLPVPAGAGPQPNPQPALARVPINMQNTGLISSLTISSDGRTLAAGCADRVVRLFDLTQVKELGQFKGHDGNVLSVVFAPNSRTVISGSADTTALVWSGDQLIRQQPVQAVELPAQKIEELWKDLSGEGQQVYAAMLALHSAPKQTVALFAKRIGPAKAVDPKTIDQMIADLDSNKFEVREKATADLAQLGDLAQPALQKVIESQPGLEVRQRVENLMERLVSDQAPPPDVLRALRVVQVLKRLGTSEARAEVQRLAGGAPGHKLTRAAESALRQMSN